MRSDEDFFCKAGWPELVKLLAAEKMKLDASRKLSSSEAMKKVSSFNIGALYITLQ